MEGSRFIWIDGEIVPTEEAGIPVLSHALHYGTAVFEGIRAYRTDTGTALFRLSDHMDRLRFSANAYGIPLERSTQELSKAAREVLAANELEEAYVRPLVYLGTGSMGLNPSGTSTHTLIAAWSWGAYLGEDGIKKGITAKVSTWSRISDDTLIPNAKGSGAYLNSVLAKTEAIRAGADEAIMLNQAGLVAEGTGENLFLIQGDEARTPPTSDGILNGITRQTVIVLLREAGYRVVEASVTRSDLYRADEAFLCGTAAEVTPVREIDDKPLGDTCPGPVTKQVQDLYARAVRGRLAQHRDWLDLI